MRQRELTVGDRWKATYGGTNMHYDALTIIAIDLSWVCIEWIASGKREWLCKSSFTGIGSSPVRTEVLFCP